MRYLCLVKLYTRIFIICLLGIYSGLSYAFIPGNYSFYPVKPLSLTRINQTNWLWSIRLSPQGAFTSKEPFSFNYILDGKYRVDYSTIKPVLNISIFMVRKISKFFSLEIGLTYLNKGAYIQNNLSSSTDSINRPDYQIRSFRYIGLPVLLKVHTPPFEIRYYVSFGFSFGTLLNSKETLYYANGDKEEIDWTERSSVTDLALLANSGLEFMSKKAISYILEINFTAGLAPYLKPTEDIISKHKHYLIGLTLGINYNFGRTSILDCPSFD